MELPEQDRQAFIDAARRRSQPKEGGAAFGVYPSSGKRPEKLNVSRDVNMPAQLARGWVAGTLGLPGDIESLGRMAVNFAFGPGGVNVDETPVLPTSEFYQEYLPGGDERPAAKFASGLGALAGGAGSTKVAGAAVKGAKATGKALGPTAAGMAESYLQRSGLAPSVIKPKGGNWLTGDVEKQTGRLRNQQIEDQAYLQAMRNPEVREPYSDWLNQKLAENPEYRNVPGIQAYNQFAKESNLPAIRAEGPEAAVNEWIDTKLNKYIRNEMGTPEDPVRKLAERDILHFEPQQVFGDAPSTLMRKRASAGMPTPLFGKSEMARKWESLADRAIDPFPAASYKYGALDENFQASNPWLEKVPDEVMVYKAKGLERNMGFDHLIDELRNATSANSDLPANLRWKPEDLKKVTMEQAVERVAKINEYRAAKKAEADELLSRNPATFQFKDYEVVPGTQEPNSKGLSWKQIRPPNLEMPQGIKRVQQSATQGGIDVPGVGFISAKWDPKTGLDWAGAERDAKKLLGKKPLQEALDYEADVMGHCVRGYCNDVLSGNKKIYSLRDKKGEPHVTIEVQHGEMRGGQSLEDYLNQPPQIVQIKGKGNAAPKAEYLPFVQDFVRSGNWSRVGDFKNTGLIEVGEKSAVGQMLKQAGETNIPPYVTRQEYDQIIDRFGLRPGFGLPQGYAKGGLVQDTDAIAAKLVATGMDKDKALTQALKMANAKQEAHMAAGGLAKLLKGAKAAGEATKAAVVVEKAAPVIPAAPRSQALEKARKNAIKVGQSPKESERMLQQGYEPDWYHGTTGDIKALERERLGQATGAESAKKAFFFVRDPSTPPPEMLEKTRDPKSLEMMKKLGFSDEELAKLNEVSMKGHGAETASGYSQIGGSREYNEAMRKANAAERAGNWSEYEKWTQIAEDAEIGRSQGLQDLVAKYGEARDVMLDRINNAVLNKPLPQQEAQALDAKMKELMPYGWYNSYSIPQLKALKGEIVKLAGPDAAAPALQSIDDFISVKANRMLEETYQEGSNVMPVALRYKNPMYYDFGGSSYRDQSYSDLIDQARAGGHDALIIKNTFDPGAGPAKLVDIGAVFKPEQVRSRFAAFDPARINESDILGAADPALLAGTAVASGIGLGALGQISKRKPEQPEQKKAAGGLAKLLKGAKKAEEAAAVVKPAQIGNYQALPLKLPRAPNLPPQELTKTAERVARQQMGEHVRRVPNKSENLAGRSMKEVERLKNLDIELQPTKQIPTPTVVPEKKGEVRIGLPGDISISDQILMSVNNLPIGAQQEGGALYGFGKMDLPDPAFWASNRVPAQQVQNKATDVANVFDTPDVLAMHLAMGHEAMNFAQHFADANLRAIQQMPVHPESAKLFNEIVRAGNPKTGEKFPHFPGVENYEETYKALQQDPEMRKWFNNRMKVDKITGPLGLPSGKEIEYAVMEPALSNMEPSMVGLSVGRLRPGAELIPDSAHKTYSHDIPGLALGRTQELLPVDLAFPDAAAHIRKTKRPDDFTATIQKLYPHQVVDEQYINQLGEYYNRLKQIRGYKKGGAVKKSGLSVLNKAII